MESLKKQSSITRAVGGHKHGIKIEVQAKQNGPKKEENMIDCTWVKTHCPCQGFN